MLICKVYENYKSALVGRVSKLISPKKIKYVCGENIELYEDGEYAYIKDGKLHIETK